MADLLLEWRGGDPTALERLTPLVYEELRRLARIQMRGERPGHTLQPTALAHEAYLRLMDAQLSLQDRTHFLSVVASVMRRVLVDHARARDAAKRGGDPERVSLYDALAAQEDDSPSILALNEKLEELARNDSRQCRVVELHYFGGLSYPEISEILSISQATVERDMRHARAWLRRELSL